jgi:membrane-associated progesterone receptor component
MVLQGIAEAVQAYTGLSPAAAATILALMLATYLLVSSLFVAPASASSAPPEPPHQEKKEEDKEKEKEEEATVPFVFPDPVEVGEVTLEQLRAYDGKDPAKQILIAIRGQVYDVSRGR